MRETKFCQSSEQPTQMHFLLLADRLVIIEIATFHLHSNGQHPPVQSSLAKYGPGLHLAWPLTTHSEQNLNEFQLEILKNAVSRAPGNLWYHSDFGRQDQKWQPLQRQPISTLKEKCNTHLNHQPLSKSMKRSGFWDVSHYGSEWMISSNLTKALHFSNKGVLSFEDQYFYPFIEQHWECIGNYTN